MSPGVMDGDERNKLIINYIMNSVLINGAIKILFGTILIGAGVVLQKKGLATLGMKVLGK